jgi:transcriptional regulator with XRE-family HTH domain
MTRGRATTKIIAKPRLRLERITRGYSLKELGKRIGYSYAGLGKVELGRNGIQPRGVKALLEVLELEFDELFELVDTTEGK